MPLISLITIARNSEATIIATLDSVHSQIFKDIEYIVIDGASTDDTLKLIQQHPVTVNQFVSEPDSGLYDALNKGIRLATGTAVGILHSDDCFYDVSSLQKVADTFLAGADACYGDLQYVVASPNGKPERVLRNWRSGKYHSHKVELGWMPPHPTFYMRKDLFEQYGYYDTSFRIAGDYDAMLRYLWVHKVIPDYIPEVLVKMRTGGASNRSIANVFRKTLEDIRALRNNKLAWLPVILYKNLSKIKQFMPPIFPAPFRDK